MLDQPDTETIEQGKLHTHLLQIAGDERRYAVKVLDVLLAAAGYVRDAASPFRTPGSIGHFFQPDSDDERMHGNLEPSRLRLVVLPPG